MVFNGGKGGQPSSGPSACGSRLCRCLGFVLMVTIGVLLYSCMTLVSRNDALSDRVLMYARELTRTRTKEQGLEKRTAEMRQQNFHCHDQLSERSREFATLKLDTDRFKKQSNEFHQKLETMATELKTKENACVQMDSSCKKRISELEDELKRLKELQEAANAECEKKVNVELARVIRVLRAKYGVEPVTELAKAGVDIARILQFMGGSQSQDSNQLQRSDQEQSQPQSGQQQPNSGQERPVTGQEPPQSGQQQPNSGQERPVTGQEQPQSGQQQPNSGQERPVTGQEPPQSSQERPKSGQEPPQSGQERAKSGQEPPQSGQEQVTQEQLQFKRPEDIKRDEDQKKELEKENPNEDGREKQKSIQEQPKTDQTENEENKSEKEDARYVRRSSGRLNRDEWQKSKLSSQGKLREDEEKRKPDDAKDGQEKNSRDDKETAASDQEQGKENQAKEEEEEEKDKAEKEDVKSSQNSDRQKADQE